MVNVCAVGLHKIEREYFDEWVAVLGQRVREKRMEGKGMEKRRAEEKR
jgi:hypothetical protein